jgi:hypothetical protein
MRPAAARKTRSPIADLPKVVAALARCALTLRQPAILRPDPPSKRTRKRANRRVTMIPNQRKGNRIPRHRPPHQQRREIVTLAGVPARDPLPRGERTTPKLHNAFLAREVRPSTRRAEARLRQLATAGDCSLRIPYRTLAGREVERVDGGPAGDAAFASPSMWRREGAAVWRGRVVPARRAILRSPPLDPRRCDRHLEERARDRLRRAAKGRGASASALLAAACPVTRPGEMIRDDRPKLR